MTGIVTRKQWLGLNAVLLGLLILTIIVFTMLGRPIIGLVGLWQSDHLSQEIFFHVRLPRVLLAAFVGASLSASGVAFQSLLRNPLADPYILGVAGGAALGSVLSLALGVGPIFLPLIAFLAALASLGIIYRLARVGSSLPVHSLLLTGVIFNALSFALILLVNSLVQEGRLHQILYLLMGSLDAIELKSVLLVGGVSGIGFGCVLFSATKMNLVSLGEEAAQQLGLNVGRYHRLLFVGASLMVGAAVSMAGLIGFVGLFIPHVMRMIFGMDHRVLVTTSALGGGIFLILCDFVARYLLSYEIFQTQLPVGVITALIGGPLFFYLLKRSSVGV